MLLGVLPLGTVPLGVGIGSESLATRVFMALKVTVTWRAQSVVSLSVSARQQALVQSRPSLEMTP